MKISVLAPWLCAVGLLLAVVLLFRSNQQKDAELAGARETIQQAEQLRQGLEQMERTSATLSNQLAQLQDQQGDLMRLRNEVRTLREQNQNLGKQVQGAQADVRRMQVQAETAQAATQRAQAEANQLAGAEKQGTPAVDRQAEYQARIKAAVDANGGPGTPQGQAVDGCINNLRQIDGAKQQWALEKQKSASDTPTKDDIMPYLGATAQALNCPAGGTYSINAMASLPTCSITSHALPR